MLAGRGRSRLGAARVILRILMHHEKLPSPMQAISERTFANQGVVDLQLPAVRVIAVVHVPEEQPSPGSYVIPVPYVLHRKRDAAIAVIDAAIAVIGVAVALFVGTVELVSQIQEQSVIDRSLARIETPESDG